MKASRLLQAPPGMIKVYSLASVVCGLYFVVRGPTALTAGIAVALFAEALGLWYMQRWAPWLGLAIMVAVGLLFIFYLKPTVPHRELKGLAAIVFGLWGWRDLRKEYRDAESNRPIDDATDALADAATDDRSRAE